MEDPTLQYRSVLTEVIEHGEWTQTQQGVDALTRIAPRPMRFLLSEGFPAITERNLAPKTSERLPVTIWRQAIGEICAFINGARTLAELESFGCHWWAAWGTPEKCAKRGLPPGDLGPGSYGAAFHDFPTANGGSFNQFAAIVEEARRNPLLRTLFVSPWIPQYIPRRSGVQQQVVVAPCHGWVHIRIIDNRLTLHMFQRSADLVIGVPSNMVQYAALTMMLARVLGCQAYEYVHSFSDAHIYLDNLDAAKLMLSRDPLPLPQMAMMDPGINDLSAFRHEHFALWDYHPHPGIANLPVAI